MFCLVFGGGDLKHLLFRAWGAPALKASSSFPFRCFLGGFVGFAGLGADTREAPPWSLACFDEALVRHSSQPCPVRRVDSLTQSLVGREKRGAAHPGVA